MRNQYSLEAMRELARAKQGKCLSQKYVNTKTKLLWECVKKHQWESTPESIIRSDSWCPKCSGNKKFILEDLKLLAKSREGECLSRVYVNVNTKYDWKCKEGHLFKASFSHINNRGQWCPICGKIKSLTARKLSLQIGKYSINKLQELAKKKGGKCLSKEYINGKTKLLWECVNGHQWKTLVYSIVNQDTWCPVCAGQQTLTLKDMKILAKSKGGKCLSKEYVNSKNKLLWECAAGHQWESVPGSINSGTWCPLCAGHQKLSITDMQALAKARGGKCLSALYINVDTNYYWECSKGHHFKNTFSHVKNGGQWCPVCSKSGVSEEVCRVTFEQIFKEKFIKIKPSWLRNAKGNLMELDGYSEKLKIAFEYQGAQHFRVLKVYTKSDEALTKRIDDDLLKQAICKANGVNLFILDETMPYDSFGKEIKKQSRSFGIDISNYDFTKIDINQAHIRKDRLEELRSLLDKKEIDLLSDKFLTVKEKYSMKCRIDGHTWKAIGSEIFAGAGCKKCAMKKLHNKQVGNIQTVIDFAESNNGTVLTKEYLGARGSYEFRCKNNHVFIGILSNLKFRKQWCPYCEKNPHRIAKLK